MTTRTTWYLQQCLAGSGLAIMDHRIAWELRPDLWSGAQDCAFTFRRDQKPDGVQRLTVTFEGLGPVLVFARSLDNLEKRLEWIVGKPVLKLVQASPEAVPDSRPNPLRQEEVAKETERLAHIRKLAVEELLGHDCQHDREVLAARAELGMQSA